MIKNIVFDIGGVLEKFEWENYLSKYFDKKTIEVLTKVTWKNPCWREFDLNNIPFEDIVKKMISSAPDYEKEVRFVFEHLGECISIQPYAIPLITELKEKGYRVFYLSNYFEYLMDANRDAISFIPYTDGGVFSCDIHLAKPDTEIYRFFCKKFALDPSECLFFDDRLENVEGAKAAGMNAIVFKNYDQAFSDAASYLKFE